MKPETLESVAINVTKGFRSLSLLESYWRRGRDSNPRYPLRYVRFRGGSFQPLTHLSGEQLWLSVERARLGIARAVDRTLVAGMQQGVRTHRSRLNCSKQSAVFQTVVADGGALLAQGEDFGVHGGVGIVAVDVAVPVQLMRALSDEDCRDRDDDREGVRWRRPDSPPRATAMRIYGEPTRVHRVRRISRSARQLFIACCFSNARRTITATPRNAMARLKIDPSTVVWQACCTFLTRP